MLVYSLKMIDRKTWCRCVYVRYIQTKIRRHDELNMAHCNGGSIFCLRMRREKKTFKLLKCVHIQKHEQYENIQISIRFGFFSLSFCLSAILSVHFCNALCERM